MMYVSLYEKKVSKAHLRTVRAEHLTWLMRASARHLNAKVLIVLFKSKDRKRV